MSTNSGNKEIDSSGLDVLSSPGLSVNKSLALTGIYKHFPGVQALENVSFTLRAGEIHVLVGENGAGTATLLKILSGALHPDSGNVSINGEPVFLKDPKTAVKAGIATIYQELSLIPWLSIAHNLFLGREDVAGRFFLSKRKLNSLSMEILSKIGVEIDPDKPVAHLGVAEQQLVEIARALSQDARFILMDEPTASLTEKEIDILFQKILALKKAGVGILYISHRLEEIARIADRITVMRDGAVVHESGAEEITLPLLITKMVGRSIANHYPKRKNEAGEILLEVEIPKTERDEKSNLKLKIPEVFHARSGEVVGIAGLVGSGRSEWARRLFGADPSIGETIKIFGREGHVKSPYEARELGLGMVPENRKEHGIIIGRSVRDNICITVLKRIAGFIGIINTKKQESLSKEYREKLSIRCSSDQVEINTLSGGNQQKVVLAKWLACKGNIIILDEPTRGIDVGAKLEMYNIINDLCSEGKSVILISSDLPELISMSDKIYVMQKGSFVAKLDAAAADQETIMYYASGLCWRGINEN